MTFNQSALIFRDYTADQSAFLMQQTALHSALKTFYLSQDAAEEVLIDGYYIDIVQDDLLIEIQTRNFSAIRNKLFDLVDRHRVRLVHPIAVEKWIVRMEEKSEIRASRRKSPRHGRIEHVFSELIRIPDLMEHPNFSLEVLLIREEEIRLADGKGSWRRNGVSIVNRRLLEIIDRRLFMDPSDLSSLLPQDLELPFTNRSLAQKLDISPRLAARMSYCFRNMKILKVTGKLNKSYLYTYTE
jgi:hypothetical protein